MSQPARVTIVLLAGGQATRLPGKLALPVAGEPMLARVYRRLTERGHPCLVSSRAPLDPTLFSSIRANTVVDEYEDAGPLGGLVSAVAAVRTPLFFAAAGDLPDLDSTFIERLVVEYDRFAHAGDAPKAVVPAWPDGKLEPLAALYDTAAFALRAGKRWMRAGAR